MEHTFTFIFCEGKEKTDAVHILTIPAKNYSDAFDKFWGLIQREVFVTEIKEGVRILHN